jgi:hypothetical protein
MRALRERNIVASQLVVEWSPSVRIVVASTVIVNKVEVGDRE